MDGPSPAESRVDEAALAGRPVLPPYLQRTLSAVLPNLSAPELVEFTRTPHEYLALKQIQGLHERKLQYAYLQLARHVCTERLKGFSAELKLKLRASRGLKRASGDGDVDSAERQGEKVSDDEDGDGDGDGDAELDGISPELILERAEIYEALGYADLALSDAYVAYTLFLVALDGHSDSDLVPVGRNGERWMLNETDEDDEEEANHVDGDEERVRRSITDHGPGEKMIKEAVYRALMLLCRSALLLGCESQAKIWFDDLVSRSSELPYDKNAWVEEFGEEVEQERLLKRVVQRRLVKEFWCIFHVDMEELRNRVEKLTPSDSEKSTSTLPLFGWSQRQLYPWNEHEPDRMSKEALRDINVELAKAAPALEVKMSILPALAPEGGKTDATNGDFAGAEEWAQLGLYAKEYLSPGSTILEERSMLTAIRPHGEALCDGCAADMEQVLADERRYCEGCNIPFCSEECHSAAKARYHVPNEQDEETEDGYPPTESPFCPGTVGIDDLHILGRAESSTTPEWDLYFLLLSRTLQVSETQQTHPLDLFEIKYLWGDFSPMPDVSDLDSRMGAKNTLPFSVRHHVELPLQWFEILMHSRRECRPYSATWLEKYDWWIVQTLFAKFRGVADAQQSTWTGKPEVAAVHPLWCLANHSCNPNVTWKPSGVRNLTVMKERIWSATTEKSAKEVNDEVWSGIKKGEEIWNHYTDIHEKDYRERRGRLQAVLGGDCRCERCTGEAKADGLVSRETK